MRQTILFLIFLLSFPFVNGKKMEVKSFSQVRDIVITPLQRKDNNGQICALVKVVIPSSQVAFEGSLIGDCEYKTSEYWCYLPEGRPPLKIKHPDCEPLLINFGTFEPEGLRSKGVYELVISLPELQTARFDMLNDSVVSRLRIEKFITNIAAVNPDYIHPRRGKLYPFKKDNKWGFLNESFQVVIPSIYSDFNNERLITEKYNSYYWMRSRDKYKWNQDFYWVKKDGLWGCIDERGETLVPFEYKWIWEPFEDYSKCRIGVAEDQNGDIWVLNRINGEKYHKVTEWEYHSNNQFIKNVTLLHIPSIGKNKDVFVDKITGQIVPIRVPSGYKLRSFLPYNRLNFFNNKKHNYLVTDSKGYKLFEGYWYHPSSAVSYEKFGYLFSIQGIYSLKEKKFIYEGDARKADMLSPKVVDLESRVQHTYFNLEEGRIIEEKDLAFQTAEKTSYYFKLIRSLDLPDTNLVDISYIGEGLFLCNEETGNKIVLIDKWGNYGFMKGAKINIDELKKLYRNFDNNRWTEKIDEAISNIEL